MFASITNIGCAGIDAREYVSGTVSGSAHEMATTYAELIKNIDLSIGSVLSALQHTCMSLLIILVI